MWNAEGLKEGDVVWIGRTRTLLVPYKVTRITKSAVFIQTNHAESRYRIKDGYPCGDVCSTWDRFDRAIRRDCKELRFAYWECYMLGKLRKATDDLNNAAIRSDNIQMAVDTMGALAENVTKIMASLNIGEMTTQEADVLVGLQLKATEAEYQRYKTNEEGGQ